MGDLDAVTGMLTDLDYPMAVVTTASPEERSGCLVGFFTQCSVRPPRLIVFLSEKNHTFNVALDADALAVHFLDRDQRELAELFGGTSEDRTDKLERCRWHDGPLGMPVLDEVDNWLVGRISDRVLGGDHVGFLLRPVAAWRDGALRQLPFDDVRAIEPGHAP